MQKFFLSLLLVLMLFACTPLRGGSSSATSAPSVSSPVIDGTTPAAPGLETASSAHGLILAGYEEKELTCSDFLETTWGSGPDQWGDPILLPARAHAGLASPVFGSQGEIYITDLANRRLLVYDQQANLIKTLALPDNDSSDPQFSWPIVVTRDKIVFPYGIDRLAILSLDGSLVKRLQLPLRFNPMAPIRKPIWVDPGGGLLVMGQKAAYYDVGWEDGNWKEISSTQDFLINPYAWDGYIGATSGTGKLVHYKVDQSIDFLKKPTEVEVEMDFNDILLGLDVAGWVYRNRWLHPGWAIIRDGLETGQKQFAIAPDHIEIPGLASDGSMYFVLYAAEDPLIQPKLVKCAFSDQGTT